MWDKKPAAQAGEPPSPRRLRDALRQVRIESAERTGVVVDLRDAEMARLEILDEALAPVFAEVPDGIDLFDPGISRGDPARLWIDAISHVVLGRDKRTYRFVQDTRHGRVTLAESSEVDEISQAVTKYIAWRVIERERALAGLDTPLVAMPRFDAGWWWRRRLRSGLVFALGFAVGLAAIAGAAWFIAARLTP